MDFKGHNKIFYTKRVISVFMQQGPDTAARIKQIHASIVSAMGKVMKVKFEGKHGLQCFQCERKGEEGFFNEEGCNTTCSSNEQHKINDFATACDGTSEDDKKFVIKRLAYAVGYFY